MTFEQNFPPHRPSETGDIDPPKPPKIQDTYLFHGTAIIDFEWEVIDDPGFWFIGAPPHREAKKTAWFENGRWHVRVQPADQYGTPVGEPQDIHIDELEGYIDRHATVKPSIPREQSPDGIKETNFGATFIGFEDTSGSDHQFKESENVIKVPSDIEVIDAPPINGTFVRPKYTPYSNLFTHHVTVYTNEDGQITDTAYESDHDRFDAYAEAAMIAREQNIPFVVNPITSYEI